MGGEVPCEGGIPQERRGILKGRPDFEFMNTSGYSSLCDYQILGFITLVYLCLGGFPLFFFGYSIT
jgi:hypothetical protein